MGALTDADDFAEVLAKVRCMARGIEYDPAIHHPDVQEAAGKYDPPAEYDHKLRELCMRWSARGDGTIPQTHGALRSDRTLEEAA
jgi:hypothetical protein